MWLPFQTRIPIIIISFNRGKFLKQVIAGYRKQSVAHELFVHDNGSDDRYTLDVLSALENEGVTVFRRHKINNADELNAVNETVSRIFEARRRSAYIVTDCDVDIADAPADAIKIYLSLLESFPDAECVGPMLKISDINKSYPLFARVMNLHIKQFWHRDPNWTLVRGKRVAYINALIDTTFAVHRAGEAFRRLKSGLRVYDPYEARHLDWYLDTINDSTSSVEISHWGSAHYANEFRDEELNYEKYKAVISGELKELEICNNPE